MLKVKKCSQEYLFPHLVAINVERGLWPLFRGEFITEHSYYMLKYANSGYWILSMCTHAIFRSLLPPPRQETLSRHSLLGPNGLRGQWSNPSTQTKVGG